jgi:hypothetical protein
MRMDATNNDNEKEVMRRKYVIVPVREMKFSHDCRIGGISCLASPLKKSIYDSNCAKPSSGKGSTPRTVPKLISTHWSGETVTVDEHNHVSRTSQNTTN